MQRLLRSFQLALASPSRNSRMAVVVGRLLAIAFLLCFGTGIYSHFIQDPLPWMVFPTRPSSLYQVTQGIHITAGIACFPLLFAKLYVVFPDLFQTPPIRSFANFLERASIALFVAASLVEITIGLLNTYQWYSLFAFPFRQTHYALSYVVIGSLAIHIAVKLPIITRYWRKRDGYEAHGDAISLEGMAPGVAAVPVDGASEAFSAAPAGTSSTAATPSTAAPVRSKGITGRVFDWIDDTRKPDPAVSRRGFLTTISVAVVAVVGLTAGQSFRFLDFANIFGARKHGAGPQNLSVNRTAAAAKVHDSAMSPDWKLMVTAGPDSKSFSLTELRSMPQHRVDLPIACVEGWSQMASWSGLRVKDLVSEVGHSPGRSVRVTSLEKGSIYAVTELAPEFVGDDLTLIALEVNGAPLDLDHGYPARLIAPARPGVLQTKWLSKLEVI